METKRVGYLVIAYIGVLCRVTLLAFLAIDLRDLQCPFVPSTVTFV
jgi:hypothetical protein